MESLQILLKKKKKKKSLNNFKAAAGSPEKKLNGNSQSPSRKIGVVNSLNGRQKIRKLAERVPCPLRKDRCLKQVVLRSDTDVTNEHCEKQILEQTIDLLDDDSHLSSDFVVESDSSIDVLPTPTMGTNPDVIDISRDVPEQKEVIDLTEPYSSNSTKRTKNINQTVIDLSEDGDNNKEEQPSKSGVCDEILVLGTYSKPPGSVLKHRQVLRESPCGPLSNQCNEEKLRKITGKLKKQYLKKRVRFENNYRTRPYFIEKSERSASKFLLRGDAAKVGENVYVNSPVTLPSNGLRPIIIDGNNVAYVHTEFHFSCKRLEICINYFKERGHKVTAFVPQFRTSSSRNDDPDLLRKLEKQGDVILTPSKRVDGKNIVPYDDRFIVQTAVLKGGVIISRDNYNDLLRENPAWAETIKYRTLAFTWVDDVLMFPKDPLGEFGPSLEEFLRFH